MGKNRLIRRGAAQTPGGTRQGGERGAHAQLQRRVALRQRGQLAQAARGRAAVVALARGLQPLRGALEVLVDAVQQRGFALRLRELRLQQLGLLLQLLARL